MRPLTSIALSFLVLAAGATPARAAPGGGAGGFARESESSVSERFIREQLPWYDNLDNALGVAREEYRPVVVFFHSPADGWCRRMRAQVFSDEAVKKQLQHYIRVEVAVEDHQETAARHLVRGIPAVRVLSAEGRVLHARDGFMDAPEMVRVLRSFLNAEFLEKADPEFQERTRMLESGDVPEAAWPDIMLSLGEPRRREALRRLILKLDPFPRPELVALLSDHRLSVRLGALELLEEVSGSSFDFDPWTGLPHSPENRSALERWSGWLENSGAGAVSSVYSVLSEDQIAGYIRDLVGDDREKSTRAVNLLRNGGENVARALESFLDHNDELNPAATRRVKELYYALVVPTVGELDADTLAFRLIHGNLDSRLEAIEALSQAGPEALPVLTDFLDDPDPLFRETVIDAALTAGQDLAIAPVREHLENESDSAVVFSALRAIGVNEIRAASELVAGYAGHADEDLSIMALESLGALRASDQSDAIAAELEDERWRVRVAALETIGKLKDSSLAPPVRPLLRDEDEFVRIAAVSTLAMIGDRGATDEFMRLYRDHEEARGAVIRALLSLKQPLPDTLQRDLREGGPEAILGVIDAVANSRPRQLDVVAPFVAHENLDVSCAAIRVVAEDGMSQYHYQHAIADVLDEGKNAEKAAALESLEFTPGQYLRYGKLLASGKSIPGIPAEIQPIYDILLERETDGRDGDSSDPALSIFRAARALFGAPPEPSIRDSAMLVLARAGLPSAIKTLDEELPGYAVSRRKDIAQALRGCGDGALPLLVTLMRDPSSDVRSAAADTLLDSEDNPEFVEALFDELTRPAPTLKPWEIEIYDLRGGIDEGRSEDLANQRARAILADSIDVPLRSFAALVLRYTWKYGDEEHLLPLTEAEEPELRRAAWFAIGRNDADSLEPHYDTIVADPSEKVRAVLPFLMGEEDGYVVHHYDSEHVQRYNDYRTRYVDASRRYYPEPAKLEALRRLGADSSPLVRIDAAFLLMAHGETIDAESLEETLSSFPDRESIQTKVSDYLEDNYQRLDPGYAFLVNYIDPDRVSDSDLSSIRGHFGSTEASEATVASLEWKERKQIGSRETATAETPRVGNRPEEKPTGKSVEVLFFDNPGCKECDRVREHLEEMRGAFPRMEVVTHNIRESDSARLNEALSERFDVPERIRMVTPAVFTGDGYLIKDDIYPTDLGELILRSSATGNSEPGWSALGGEEIDRAGSAIERRYSSVGLAVILSAGLLDGINPCAFATIILFLSYLQIARHGPRQILLVGLAFILAVFLTYFALGLGLVEVVTRLHFLQGVGIALNVALAGFALVIMFLSFRDGVLCLQGKLAETTLQLPVFLKDRIRRVARDGARHRRYVVAAFVSGVVISVLELACTGQVYLPTINYMVQEGKTSAYFFLLIYNLAFVTPLIVIFILAFHGLRSESLIEFQRKHSAVIKFATAALFLALSILLLYPILK